MISYTTIDGAMEAMEAMNEAVLKAFTKAFDKALWEGYVRG